MALAAEGKVESQVLLQQKDSRDLDATRMENMEGVDYESLPSAANLSTHLCAGAFAGTMEHCLMYPVDCIKVSEVDVLYS